MWITQGSPNLWSFETIVTHIIQFINVQIIYPKVGCSSLA